MQRQIDPVTDSPSNLVRRLQDGKIKWHIKAARVRSNLSNSRQSQIVGEWIIAMANNISIGKLARISRPPPTEAE